MTSSLFGSAQRSVWFTADQHLGHERIIEIRQRPFDSVAQMNRELIDRHNMLVEEQDIVWIMGGICGGPDLETTERSLSLIKELNGTKYLIAGNCDLCFTGYLGAGPMVDPKQRERWIAQYLDAGIKHVSTGSALAHKFGTPVRLRLGGHAIDLAAFPYESEGDQRWQAWRPRRPGRASRGRFSAAAAAAAKLPTSSPSDPWLVHGHVHNAWRVHNRQINVGVDMWNYAPVAAEMVTALINEQDEQAS